MKNISKKFLSLLISICMVVSVFPLAANAAETEKSWKYVGDSGFSGANYPTGSQLVLDSGNNPYVAYITGGSLTVMRYNGESWEPVGDAISSVASGFQLAVNDSGTPYVAYQDAANATNAYVVRYGSDGWKAVGSVLSTDGAASVSIPSLAFDNSGTPYIAYQSYFQGDRSGSWKSAVKKYDGSDWEFVGPESIVGDSSCSYASIGFDSRDNLYACIKENTKPVVLKYADGGWNPVGSSGLSDTTGGNAVSFTIDVNDTLFVAYNDLANSAKTTVMKYSPESGSWVSAGEAFSDGMSGASHLVLAAGGSALYLLQNTEPEDEEMGSTTACVKVLNGTTWEDVGDLGSNCPYSLAAGIDGAPYIVYNDNSTESGYALSVKKYAPSEYTISYAAGAHGTLSSSDPETVTAGGSPSHVPTVTPASGYSFAGWSSDGGTTEYTTEQLAGLTVTADTAYTAYYARTFPSNYAWQNVGSAGFQGSGVTASAPRMVMDPGGTPYVSYRDSDHNFIIRKYSENQWQMLGGAFPCIGAGNATLCGASMAVSDDGVPYATTAYANPDGGITVSIGQYVGNRWLLAAYGTLSSNAGDTVSDLALGVSHDGTPYLASSIKSSSGSYSLSVYKCNTVSQQLTLFDEALADGKDNISLAFNNANQLFMTYRDADNKPQLIRRGVEWIRVGGYSSLYNSASTGISLALDGSGKAYVAFTYGSGNAYQLNVKTYNYDTDEWNDVTSWGPSSFPYTDCALACDRDGNLFIAPTGNNSGSYIADVRLDVTTSSWNLLGSRFHGQDLCSLSFDGDGTPYVALLDTQGKLSVMKYAQGSYCTVTYAEGDHGTLSSSSSETVNSGASPKSVPTVTPASGYSFAGWSSDGGTTKYTSAQLAGLTITANVTFTAYYTEQQDDPGFTKDGITYEVTGTNPNRVKVIPKESGGHYSGSVTVPSSVTNNSTTYAVTEIGEDAFSCSDGLTGVTLPTSITVIGKRAFESCTGLTSLILPSGIAEIGDSAFVNCTHLSNVSLPSTVTSIGTAAFGKCPALTGTITIPVGVEYVGGGAFAGDSVTGFSVDADNTHYCAADGILFSKDKTVLVEYPSGKPGNNYSIPTGVTSIGDYAFALCTALTKVTIPSGVTSIGAFAFGACTGLTGITIPASVTTVDMAAFLQCRSLSSAVFNGGTVPTLLHTDDDMPGVFAICNSLRAVYVPASALQSYRNLYREFGLASSDKIMTLTPLSSPSGLSWNGTAAAWSAVENASGYTVQLYKNGTACGSAVTVNSATLQYDFSAAVAAAGSGAYTFTVTANGGTDYGDSTASPASVSYSYEGNSSGSSSGGTTTAKPAAPSTQTQVNPAGNTATVTTVADSVTTAGDTAQITATATNITTDTTGTSAALDIGKAAKVEIELPKDAIEQQLAAKKDVDLTVTVPHNVTQGTNADLSLDINASAGILAAAKASGTDLTIHIKDADTQQVAYTWTFRGSDLATSTTPVVDVNVSMAVRLTTEVPQVNRVTPDRLGLVLMFDHSGVLPSTASVTFSVKDQGFKPGQKLYFYFYNKVTGQIEPQDQEYTVDADGNVTVKISHCSNYVLLPNLARTITLDTRSYTMAPGKSYTTGVKLAGVSGVKIKAYSSTRGVADVTVLKNGNVKATGVKPGLTYIMIDVYDGKNKLLTHASVRLTVKNIVKPNGNSTRQYGIF